MSGRPTVAQLKAWADEVAAVGERIGGRFARSEPRQRAIGYVRGLLSGAERKNGWQLAEHLGDPTPDGVQHLLARADWDADAVRDDLIGYVQEHLGDAGGVLIVDETGFLKKGTKSCGVARQYSGTAGRIGNCQVGVFLGYATTQGRALVDRALYRPKEWAGDADRRTEAGIPEAIAFATQIVLARRMIDRAVAAGGPARWVTADAWHRLSCGDGSKGPRVYDWALSRTDSPEPDEYARWVLIRRSVSNPEDVAYFACGGPPATTLNELVRIAGARWAVEDLFALAKGDCGMDAYEVRSWAGWHRHVPLSLLALAVVAVIRSRAARPAKKGA
jgi:SRSO17 transposase